MRESHLKIFNVNNRLVSASLCIFQSRVGEVQIVAHNRIQRHDVDLRKIGIEHN
jgi:hypothetical protein